MFSCLQLCAAVRVLHTGGSSVRAPGTTAGLAGQSSPGHPLALGQAEDAVLGSGLPGGLMGSCGTAGTAAAGPGELAWAPGLWARQGTQTLTDHGVWVKSFDLLTEAGKSLTLGMFCHV